MKVVRHHSYTQSSIPHFWNHTTFFCTQFATNLKHIIIFLANKIHGYLQSAFVSEIQISMPNTKQSSKHWVNTWVKGMVIFVSDHLLQLYLIISYNYLTKE